MGFMEIVKNCLGCSEILGIDLGFWVANLAVLLIVIIMNVFFWRLKPKKNNISRLK